MALSSHSGVCKIQLPKPKFLEEEFRALAEAVRTNKSFEVSLRGRKGKCHGFPPVWSSPWHLTSLGLPHSFQETVCVQTGVAQDGHHAVCV